MYYSAGSVCFHFLQHSFDDVRRVCCAPVKASMIAQVAGSEQTGRIPTCCCEVTSVVKNNVVFPKEEAAAPSRAAFAFCTWGKQHEQQQQRNNQHIFESEMVAEKTSVQFTMKEKHVRQHNRHLFELK